QRVAAARTLIAQPGRTPPQQAEDQKNLAEGLRLLGEAVRFLEARAEALKQPKPDAPARARMLYDAAWAARALADAETETARERVRQEKWQKLKDDVARRTPPGQPPPFVAPPEVARS